MQLKYIKKKSLYAIVEWKINIFEDNRTAVPKRAQSRFV